MKYPLTCLEGNNNLAFVSTPLRPFKGDTALAMGTGFFFQPVFGRIFLITNRHMVIDEQSEFYPDHLQLKLHTDPLDLTKFQTLDRRDVWVGLKSPREICERAVVVDAEGKENEQDHSQK